jgi:Ca2+-binding RTX toxin-like protein
LSAGKSKSTIKYRLVFICSEIPLAFSPRSLARRLLLDTFESRIVPATASFNAGILAIVGTTGDDTLSVEVKSGKVVVFETVAEVKQKLIITGAPVSGLNPKSITRIDLLGDDGDDSLTVAASVTRPASIQGGAGDDSLTGGNANDTILGNSGNDLIRGGAGNDLIYGSEANPASVYAQDDDSLFGDAGNDTIHGLDGDDLIQGGAGNDSLFGNAGYDSIEGNGGNDTIAGGDDDDLLNGNAGNDHISGEAGNDTIFGDTTETGNDSLFGGVGDDTIYAGLGNDSIEGGADSDYIEAGGGNDAVVAGTDFDAGLDIDTVFGGAGNDTLQGGWGDDSLYGEAGNDLLVGGAGMDLLSGSTGRDRFVGHGTTAVGTGLATDPENFDTYQDEFNLGKAFFGAPSLLDLQTTELGIDDSLAALGAIVAKPGKYNLTGRIRYLGTSNYLVKLGDIDGAEWVPVHFDGTWSDSDPMPSARERFLSATSGTQQQAFWSILFHRARMASAVPTFSPLSYYSQSDYESLWTSMATVESPSRAITDYTGESVDATLLSGSTAPGGLSYQDLVTLLAQGKRIMAVSDTTTSYVGLDANQAYTITRVFKAKVNGVLTELITLYNPSGFDQGTAGSATLDKSGTIKNDGYITIPLAEFYLDSNFATVFVN